MKYYCKIVYKDKIEPTIYFKDNTEKEAKEKILELLDKLFENDEVEGIYLGKK
ncbi:hypothetical protein K144313037_15110 [Clostridium tetani]|uniref:Uncharacterized protein n=1 Tax=Clostridium tetani TaxID=1513 RepID=A0ABC8EEL9_CLOTA|nr:hypothetical protein [Clostridium tetani]WFN61039.1 hypothetical protein PAA20_08845 [Clostridium tetani]SUY56268.1 Uncharacterised protein [Clostridium tetani]BDR64693.1 hypothetical protein K134307016_16270 [Clostridium tetani]BDR67478.1 hypothetical protein K144312032_17060 [Clostridium tetani]BDR70099.1 hypothetical protein K144313037_15110 [Clostridium tetani]